MKKPVLIVIGILVVLFGGFFVADSCIAPKNLGDMSAEVRTRRGSIEITNKNDFHWYGLIITLNERYSNRILMDRDNWPYFDSDRVHRSGETRSLPYEDNFVHSENEYLDDEDVWWDDIEYTGVDRIQLDAKSSKDGGYDLRSTYGK